MLYNNNKTIHYYAFFSLFIATINADGTTYERWGRSDCPRSATQVYSGLIVGAWETHSGGLGYTCFPLDPEPVYVHTGKVSHRSFVHSTEYETVGEVFSSPDLSDYDAPCAVCFVPRATTLMLPAQVSCPNDWTLEYSGYLMTNDHSSGGACVDVNAGYLDGSQADRDGEILYFVVTSCSSSFMPCLPYKHSVPITCAVCTR